MQSIKEIGRRGRYAFALLALVLAALILAKAPSIGSSSTASQPTGKAPGPQVAAPSGSGSTALDASKLAAATGAPGTVYVAHSVKNDVSPPLRDIKPVASVGQAPEDHDVPVTYPKGHVNDPVVQNWFGALTMPTPIVNFDGVANMCGCYPPDTEGDVGPNHYVQWV